jgi:1L-myo-inositol 1-phosphate cytidylyltransferase / CDP-L-myo-inositol myo-inositolphosphotransferase
MDGMRLPSCIGVRFASADEAGRRVAGVAAAARIVREMADARVAEVWLAMPPDEALDEAAQADLVRLSGTTTVRFGEPPHNAAWLPGDRLVPAAALGSYLSGSVAVAQPLDAAAILRATAKPSDGLVSRWINRPLSRRLSAVLLRMPGLRPNHLTIGTGLLALAMLAVMLTGEPWGLIAGGLLFHAASVFDGVDGEVARATFRTSRKGAALDSVVDVATNLAMVVGLTANLALRGHSHAVGLAGFGLVLFVLGLGMIGIRAARTGRPFGFDLVKHHYRGRYGGALMPLTIEFLTIVSSRDFFALLFAVLIVIGYPMAVLYLFTTAATIWICFVTASALPSRDAQGLPTP